MSDKPSFAEIIVARLGTPKDPFGWEDLLALAVLAAVFAGYVALEYGAARLVARFFAWLSPKAPVPPPED